MKRLTLLTLGIIAALYVAVGSTDVAKEKLKTQDTTIVTATIYKPSCGTKTADGFRFSRKHAGIHKLIAVSWDLRKKYPFGTKVYLSNAGQLSGIYTVRDLMAKRWRSKVDILVDQKHPLCRFSKVAMVRMPDSLQPERLRQDCGLL